MNENELTISFPSLEDRTEFIKWFETKGFELFNKEPENMITCLVDVQNGVPENEEDYGEMAYIELQ